MILALPQARLVLPAEQETLVEVCATGAALCYRKDIDEMSFPELSEFLEKRIKIGHESVIEHASFSALLLTNRGVTHELVRHRIGVAFTQESTRFTNYEKKDGHVTFIIPPQIREEVHPGIWNEEDVEEFQLRVDLTEEAVDWVNDMRIAEFAYFRALRRGWAPEEARCYLNNATATRILVTANMREWRHVFNLRVKGTTGRPHPEIKEVIGMVHEDAATRYPTFFA